MLAAAVPARALDIDVSTFTLDNGMQVVVIPDRRAPVVTHMVWYKVGAADEPQGKAGIAHFLEHLMFKGTPKYPDGAFSRIIRANGGNENAFTTQDYTAYFQRVMKERLPLVMELEADRMQNLVLTDENVLPERAVVQEERRERTENEPARPARRAARCRAVHCPPLWQARHRLDERGGPSSRARMRSTSTPQHYEPANAILIVAGDVTADEVKTLAERYYGPLKNKRPVAERRRTAEPPPNAERRVTMRDARASTPSWQRQYLTPAARHLPQREELAMSLLADILGGGNQSRLYQKLTVEKKIAAYAGAWFSADHARLRHLRPLRRAQCRASAIEEVEKGVDAVLADLIAKGVTQEELDRSRNSVIASATYLLDSQESLARVFGVALATGQTIEDVHELGEATSPA